MFELGTKVIDFAIVLTRNILLSFSHKLSKLIHILNSITSTFSRTQRTQKYKLKYIYNTKYNSYLKSNGMYKEK